MGRREKHPGWQIGHRPSREIPSTAMGVGTAFRVGKNTIQWWKITLAFPPRNVLGEGLSSSFSKPQREADGFTELTQLPGAGVGARLQAPSALDVFHHVWSHRTPLHPLSGSQGPHL